MKDKIKLKLIELERQLTQAKAELSNENATFGTIRKCHLEIEKLTFTITTIKFLQNDN